MQIKTYTALSKLVGHFRSESERKHEPSKRDLSFNQQRPNIHRVYHQGWQKPSVTKCEWIEWLKEWMLLNFMQKKLMHFGYIKKMSMDTPWVIRATWPNTDILATIFLSNKSDFTALVALDVNAQLGLYVCFCFMHTAEPIFSCYLEPIRETNVWCRYEAQYEWYMQINKNFMNTAFLDSNIT